jgi:predicted ATPase
MRLTSIRAQNFKSFGSLDIQLENLNVLIGANASGKSNFVQLFTFLRDIVESGLENAISIQGGPYIRSTHCSEGAPVTIYLSAEPDAGDPITAFMPGHGQPSVVRCEYRFALAISGARTVTVVEEELRVERSGHGTPSNPHTFAIQRAGDHYRMEGGPDRFGAYFLELLNARSAPPGRPVLLIEYEFLRSMLPLQGLRSIASYHIDSQGPKAPSSFGGKSELEPDARNLAIVLDRIFSDQEDRRKFLNLLRDLAPFAEDLNTESLTDSSRFFSLRERFSHLPMPASLLSDGAIHLICLIAILYFEPRPLVLIEEPERNLHPSSISKLVEHFKDAARQKQIVISTHSPEIVRAVEPGQLILLSRDPSGVSRAERPAGKAQVQQYLRDKVGIEELYVQNLLEF